MTGPALVLVLAVAVLFAAGFNMLMERSLIRIVIGFMLLGHGANVLLLLAGGAAGSPPLLGGEFERPMADPLPQAMVLTAIVITFGVTAFLLALAFRSRILLGEDEVRDDVEDRRVHAGRRQEAWAGGEDESDPLEENTELEETGPENTLPDNTGPDSTEPKSTEPKSTEPKSTEPKSTGPGSTGRDGEEGGGA